MSTPSTIDLGTVGAGPPAAAGPPLRQRWHSWQQHHRWALLATTLAVLVGTSSAAAPLTGAPWLVPVLTVDRDADGFFLLADDLLYVADNEPDGGFTAYRVDDGQPAWQATGHQYPLVVLHDGTPFVLEFGSRLGPAITAIDPETGQPRWREHGDLAGGATDLVVLLRRLLAEGPDGLHHPELATDSPIAMTGRALTTGDEQWTVGPVSQVTYRFGSRQLVLFHHEDHRLTSYSLVTGQQLASTRWPNPMGFHDLLPTSELLLLWEEPIPELIALDSETLAQRWRAEIDMRGRHPFACEPLVCLTGGTPAAIDPATGQTVWQADWLGQPEWLSSGVAAGTPVLVTDEWILDTATGEPLLQLDQWQPYHSDYSTELLLVWHEDSAEGGAPRAWFGRVATDPPAVRVLGNIDGYPSDCHSTANHLACRVGDQVRVWRIAR